MTRESELQPMECSKHEAECSDTAQRRRQLVPRSDIYETANDIVVVADMPGVDENSVDITVEKNILSIKGSVEVTMPDGVLPTYVEYAVGDYQRKFALPNEIDRNGITARMKNGVLTLILPKSASAQVKKIAVRSE